MIQIGIQAVPSAFPQPSPAAPAEVTGHQAGKDPGPSGSRTAVEDQRLFTSPPPLPFPRVFPGL